MRLLLQVLAVFAVVLLRTAVGLAADTSEDFGVGCSLTEAASLPDFGLSMAPEVPREADLIASGRAPMCAYDASSTEGEHCLQLVREVAPCSIQAAPGKATWRVDAPTQPERTALDLHSDVATAVAGLPVSLPLGAAPAQLLAFVPIETTIPAMVPGQVYRPPR